MGKNTLISYKQVDIYQGTQLILGEVDLTVNKGDFIYLVGKVGSGKSTLLKSFYNEIPLATGEAEILDYNLIKINRRDTQHLRKKIGIVFQDFQLLIDRTIYDNLKFVLHSTGWKNKELINSRIIKVLEQVDMYDKQLKMPHELSGGEQQRIAIARALLNSPDIILADEPTGNLDPQTGELIMQLLYEIKENDTAVIVSTHNLKWLEQYPGKVFKCEHNRLHEQTCD